MPDVPNVPGVPPLTGFSSGTSIALLAADIISFLSGPPVWGIFLSGQPVIAADNMVTLDFRQDFPISDYPVEPNSFQSYNKVELPGDVRVSMSRGGSQADRQQFLSSVHAVMNTTDLYDIQTPEITYTGFNFTHLDYRRSARNGVGLITVDLWMTQVRQTSTAQTTSTQQPGDSGQVGNGNVQPVQASPSLQTILGL